MKKGYIYLSLLITILFVSPVSASSGKLKSDTIIECSGVYYGTHGSDNHYHKAILNSDGSYTADGSSLGTDLTCTLIAELLVNEQVTVTFKSCVDGDTAIFNLNDEEIKVRFLAIDTPETKHPTKGEEPYGKEASNYTCDKLTNAKEIILEYDAGSDKLDKYERHLGWIFVDGNLIQEELISLGYAQVAYLYGNYAYTSLLEEKQEIAKSKQLGIWSDTEYSPTVEDDEEITEESNEEDSFDLIYLIVLPIILIASTLIKKKR